MNKTRRTCKYWSACGSGDNCAACRGGYVKKAKSIKRERPQIAPGESVRPAARA